MDQHVACINTNRLNNNTLVLSRTAVLKYKEPPAKIVLVDHHIPPITHKYMLFNTYPYSCISKILLICGNFYLLVLFHLQSCHLILTAPIRKIFNSDAMYFCFLRQICVRNLLNSHFALTLVSKSSGFCEFLTPILF